MEQTQIGLTEEIVSCPYCSELIDVLINPEEASQEYIEGCLVCCKPITFIVTSSIDEELSIECMTKMKLSNKKYNELLKVA